MESSARDTPVVQQSLKHQNLPLEIRLGFVKKVYGILVAMLVVSSCIAAPFVFDRRTTLDFMRENPWIAGAATAFLVLHQLVNLAMCFESCCGGGPCMRVYLKMFVTVPWNYLFVMSYAVCFGVLLGFICSTYSAESVALVLALTAVIVVSLTIFAVVTKTDFTGCGMYVFMALVGFLLFLALARFFPHDSLAHKAGSAFGAVLFGFLIVYDTQLIFGTASVRLGNSAARKLEFTVDMYCFAAYQLYLDVINLLLHLLEIFGRRN